MDIDGYLSSPDALRETASVCGQLLQIGQEMDVMRLFFTENAAYPPGLTNRE